MYFLSGFEEDLSKSVESQFNLNVDQFGDSVTDSNNSYFLYWFSDAVEKFEILSHTKRKENLITQLITYFDKLNPSKLKLHEVIICLLFSRRLKTFVNKQYVKSRFLDLKKYPKDDVYNQIINDIGLSVFKYLNTAIKYVDIDPNDKQYANKKLKMEALATIGYEYQAYLSMVENKAVEAIDQMINNYETSPANPTIPGHPVYRSSLAALEKFKSNNIVIKDDVSTMATCAKGKLYIGPEFFDVQFSKNKIEPNAIDFEYFKTIVAHEAMHQIFFAFDKAEIYGLLPDKYAKLGQGPYQQLLHTAANIIQDCFLNCMLEDWHFKIKPEWYNDFYFPKDGVKTFKFDVLKDDGIEYLRNNAENADEYIEYIRNGEIKIGISATITQRNFPQDVIAFENEGLCVGYLFMLMYHDSMYQSTKPKQEQEQQLNNPKKDSPSQPSKQEPSKDKPKKSDGDPSDGKSGDSVSEGEICELPDGTFGRVTKVDVDGSFDIEPISKDEVDRILNNESVQWKTNELIFEGTYTINDVTFITGPNKNKSKPSDSQPQEPSKKKTKSNKPEDENKDDNKSDDTSDSSSKGEMSKSESDKAKKDVQDYLDKIFGDNGRIMDEESHDDKNSLDDESDKETDKGTSEKDSEGEQSSNKGESKKSETSKERKSKMFQFTPFRIKNDSYKNILERFFTDKFKYIEQWQRVGVSRPRSYVSGGRLHKEQKIQIKQNSDIDSIVVAIDTSGSISTEMVRSFLNIVYTILLNQAINSKLVDSTGTKLAAGVKEEDLFNCIPIFWHNTAYFPNLSNGKLEDFKLNCLNFKTKISSIMSHFTQGSTELSSVVKKYNEIQKILGPSKKIAGIIYFSDMELYESPIYIAPAPAVKMIAIKDPRDLTYFYKNFKFKIPSGTIFNPSNDIVYDPTLDPKNRSKGVNESKTIIVENMFKIFGKLYKDL